MHDDETRSIVSEVEYPSHSGEPPENPNTPRDSRRRRGSDAATAREDSEDDDHEPAEMTALRLELSTLSTSHTSLQSTLQLLQAQLSDLQRVNSELQEENEAWSVLVQQRTLAGTFDVMGISGDRGSSPNGNSLVNGEDEMASLRSTGKNTLDKVSELDELAYEAQNSGPGELDPELMDPDGLRRSTSSSDNPYGERSELDPELFAGDRPGSRQSGTSKRRGHHLNGGLGTPKGETLADLPITGPGLDLAAELGRAENAGGFMLDKMPKSTRKKSGTDAGDRPQGKYSETDDAGKSEVETLRGEVKNLKDANKALSLYASKIIDRIISIQGFEHVVCHFVLKIVLRSQ